MPTTAADIVSAVGGAGNISSMTHCATRLRFQLKDGSAVSTPTVEAIPGVMGAVPQSGDRYQVVIGGAVTTVYNEIMALPEMAAGASGSAKSDADVKAEARSGGPRGKFSWLDNFFEFLSDSFRPIIGALLGASLFITFMSLMATTGVIGNWADPRATLPVSWQFVNLAWKTVFYFLPLMVAYNASKKVGADPWVGFAIMAIVMLPGFSDLSKAAHTASIAGSDVSIVHIFGLPLTIFDYGQQVFPPLLMAAVLGPLTRGLKKIIAENVQLIFVPFLAMLIMLPLTAFIIGPIGVYVGAYLAQGLSAVNNFSPFIFAIIIPLAYPFMVPLGLHWPINAIMLLNIQTLGYDFIQGPMGAWNFACFGATAGVMVIAMKDKDKPMRQTATGALVAGLVGGISEPSLYGIHLRYKRIYPSMLVGCVLGGLIIGIGGGLHTSAFVFTSLLTIPAFNKIPLYTIAIAAAFFASMALVIIRDYRTPEERAEVKAAKAAQEAAEAAPAAVSPASPDVAPGPVAGSSGAATATALAERTTTEVATITVTSPLEGRALPITEIPDPVFSTGVVGQGIAIDPSNDTVVAPGDGTVVTAPDSGHAFGLKLDSGVELLIHVGVDTVELGGKGFDVKVAAGDRVSEGQPLVVFDKKIIADAGYSNITPVLVTNGFEFSEVAGIPADRVAPGTPVITVTR
ncbi:PTS beta-glucoside transporter subunit EIIBCA [Acidipropionibacterium acidipropionici]|uniref:PTS beta-glucoside transporter subunit EIIBCA n=1 Tax=Acidipropionibacterium acidipropionici TaxID=1748 RepID=A0AAC9AMR7_9ACTN|nr:glucose PTS transporter subunit IIA [Acidipropionibacterium acidipropionici]AMS04404.1 PTS beta-glucoside transporter subunit EIIBCA [Acidipropionibacterium acidipropionici]AOZ45898.1 PTS beta-glucoside transporter subunit EIIBCA [Acidipropionibacterium acidipropionici]AZP38087.1 PTS beta-glucoside transporter subunit EIIBCA [Acidipropionibacterium acidipropionici]